MLIYDGVSEVLGDQTNSAICWWDKRTKQGRAVQVCLFFYYKFYFTHVEFTPPLLISTYKASDDIPSTFQNIVIM